MEEDIISLLYKAAKKHDLDILKHFNDENLSDRNYFLYAINDDIMSNTINVILNLSINNLESPGIDNSCRMIIEAITLLSLYNANQISDLQLEIFRHSYALVEIDNYRSFMKNANFKVPLDVEKDKEIALNLFAKQFGITRKELDELIKNRDPSKKIYLSDPLAFLMRTPKTKIKIDKLIKKYHPHKETIAEVYTFFSIFDHPRYEENIELEMNFQEAKKKFVFSVITTVIEYFKLNKLFLSNSDEYTDDLQDLFKGEYEDNNKNALKAIEMIFGSLIDKLAIYSENEIDLQVLFYLNKLRCIAKNMFVCMHRGHREQVIAVFRPFAELSSVINKINTYDVDQFHILRKAFMFSSRLQLINLVDNVTNKVTKIDNESLKDLYEKYYKEKYNLDSYIQFEREIVNNSLYFLDKSKKSYKNLVMDNSNIIFKDKTMQEEFKTLYKVSIDMSHSSGYVFNACPSVVDSLAFRSQIVFWMYVYQYASLVALTKIEHGYPAEIDKVMKAIKILIDGLADDLDKLYK